MSILSDPNVKKLAEKFDLELPKYYLVIDRYAMDGKQLVIKSVKVFDSDDNFVKFADTEKLFNHLHEYPIKFKEL